jgi:hypothetical protein
MKKQIILILTMIGFTWVGLGNAFSQTPEQRQAYIKATQDFTFANAAYQNALHSSTDAVFIREKAEAVSVALRHLREAQYSP